MTLRNCWLLSDPLFCYHLVQSDTTDYICSSILHLMKGRMEEQGEQENSQNNDSQKSGALQPTITYLWEDTETH